MLKINMLHCLVDLLQVCSDDGIEHCIGELFKLCSNGGLWKSKRSALPGFGVELLKSG